MRIPVLTIHGDNDIEVTATYHNNEKEYLSKKNVTGIVLLVEQWNSRKQNFSDISYLIDGERLVLLAKRHCDEEFVSYMSSKLSAIIKEIKEYVEE